MVAPVASSVPDIVQSPLWLQMYWKVVNYQVAVFAVKKNKKS